MFENIDKYIWIQPTSNTSFQSDVITVFTVGVIYSDSQKEGYIQVVGNCDEDFLKLYNDIKSRIELS